MVSYESTMVKGFKPEAESIAIAVRKELKVSVKDCLPADQLADHLRIRLLTPRDIPDLDAKSVGLLGANDGGFSAVHLKMCDRHFVVVNHGHAPTRRESDIMHELAHVIRRHRPSGVRMVDDHLQVVEYDEEQEKEAEFLGGCLQIPKDGLVQYLFAGHSRDWIAEHYVASRKMVDYRVFATGAEVIVKRTRKRWNS